jgi:transposase
MTDDSITKSAAIHLLRRGYATQSEIAKLSGRSRQIISHWAKEYPDARADYLAAQWEKALARASKR